MILLSMKYEIHILLQNHNSYLKKTNEPHREFTIEFLRNFGMDLMILHWGIFDIFWLFCFVYFFLLVVFFPVASSPVILPEGLSMRRLASYFVMLSQSSRYYLLHDNTSI